MARAGQKGCGCSCGGIKWLWVFKYQDLFTALMAIGFGVGWVVLQDTEGTTTRPFLTYDATISLPFRSGGMPYDVALIAPCLTMFFCFVIGELLMGRQWHGGLTGALAALVFFTIDGMTAFVMAGFSTQVTKASVGVYRPDWLSRCQPATAANSPVVVAWGQPPSTNPPCTSTNTGRVKDGRYSFPSGHVSTAFVFATYSTCYCIYAFYVRTKQQPPAAPAARPPQSLATPPRRTWASRLGRDFLGLLGFLLILLQMAFAWYTALSRIKDNKHAPADVLGGTALGTACGLLFCLRALPQHRRLDDLDDADDAPEPGPLPLTAAAVALSAASAKNILLGTPGGTMKDSEGSEPRAESPKEVV